MKAIRRIHVAVRLMLVLFAAVTHDAAHAADKKIIRVPVPVQSEADLGFVGVSRSTLLATYKRIGVLTAELPPGFRSHDEARRAIEAAVIKRLQLAGFEVVPPDSFATDFAKAEHDMGGFFDPNTGALNDAAKTAAFDIARRDFVARERLDAYVTLNVRVRKASGLDGKCEWDNVVDYCYGPLTGLAPGDKWNGAGGSGSVGAYSLELSVLTPDEKAIFVRSGGIQPAAYLGVTTRMGYIFPEVPRQDALRDTARIERAAQAATVPLLLPPLEIAKRDRNPEINGRKINIASLPVLPTVRLQNFDPPFRIPRDEVLHSVHRVALTETGTAGKRIPYEVRERLRELIKAELAPLGWQIVDALGANSLLAHSIPDFGIYDPFSGARDESRIAELRRSAINSLELEPFPDAILWIDIVPRTVVYSFGDVRWDGAEQSAITLGPIEWSLFGRKSSANVGGGPIQAVSLGTRLTGVDGRILYDSLGGIQLLQRIWTRGTAQYMQMRVLDLPSEQLFRDPAREKGAVHLALRSLVLRPEELEAEQLHPPVEKPQE